MMELKRFKTFKSQVYRLEKQKESTKKRLVLPRRVSPLRFQFDSRQQLQTMVVQAVGGGEQLAPERGWRKIGNQSVG